MPALCEDIQLVRDEYQAEVTEHKMRENYARLQKDVGKCKGINAISCIKFRQNFAIYVHGTRNMDAAISLHHDFCDLGKNNSNACTSFSDVCLSWREEIDRFSTLIRLSGQTKRYENIMRACNRVLTDACKLPNI